MRKQRIILPYRLARNTHRSVLGFTLLELMMVVVVVAILAAIAIPAYGRYAYRARRADGKDAIMRLANYQERYYTANNKYDFAIPNSFKKSEKKYYNLVIKDLGGEQAYRIVARPRNEQLGDQCKNLRYTNTGVKSYTGDESNGKCW